MGGGKADYEHQIGETIRMVPHPRTLRKARDQVKTMVINGCNYRLQPQIIGLLNSCNF